VLVVERPKCYCPVVPPDLRFLLVRESLVVRNGHVRVPTAPGLGVGLGEAAVARHRLGA